MDYQPLNIDPARNAAIGVIPNGQNAPRGFQRFHGLPFQIGDGERAIIALGGESLQPVRIDVGATARSILVAHRLLESRVLQGALPGGVVATYRVQYASGEREDIPIRERFEIAAPLGWGQLPFAALPDQKNFTVDRWSGRWSGAGERQTEVDQADSLAYYVWYWPNSRASEVIESIEIVPAGPRFVIAAITLGHVDENPLTHTGAVPVRVDLKDPAVAARRMDGAPGTGLDIQVDRGIAGYAFPLPTRPVSEFLADGMAGWGERQNQTASPAYAEVAAAPSATIALASNGEAIDAVRFADLVEQGVIESPRSRIAIVEAGRNWVETLVIDDATNMPVPCRVHFRSPDGVPYQPHGHHGHVNSNNGTWHIDIGGDLRLGQITYAYIDGRCQGWLPRGDLIVDVARGYEYEPLRQRVTIAPGQRRLELRLRRLVDMNARRWFSGDTHVHFLSTQGSHFEARGEDLNVVNLLLSQWGNLFTNTEEFTGSPSVSRDGRTIVWATQENRQHLLGHLTLLGLKEAVYPWCSDGPGEAELGGTLDVTMSHWADACRAQGGTVILPHLPNPNGEPAAMIATGRVDGVEMLTQTGYNHLEYYRYLNSGYRLPLVGGTDKMSSDVAVGQYRTYVRIPADEDFTYDSWCANLKRGRTFLSGGPMIEFTVEGQEIGDTLRLPRGGGTVEVTARATSTIPIHTLQIVERGQVVAQTDSAGGSRSLDLRTRLTIRDNSWLCARAAGPGYGGLNHHDCWSRGVFAHTSPIYCAVGGEWEMADPTGLQYMLTMVDGSLKYIRDLSPRRPSATTTHHHGEADHQAYLERPFIEAREALHRRMHALGLAH